MTQAEIEMFEAYLDGECANSATIYAMEGDCTSRLEYDPEAADEMYIDDMRAF